MMPWNEEGMEGATHVGTSARVIEFPSRALSLREERGPAGPSADRDPDSPEAAAKTIHQIARSNVMRSLITIVLFAAVALSTLFAARSASASEPPGRRIEVSLLGGIHSVNQNDTAIPDNMTGVPVVGAVSYQLSPNFAAEGEFSWFIPVIHSVDMGGVSQDRKAPDALAYQVGLRASYPLNTWSPYVAAGAGAMTFLSSSGADRTPSLDKAETMFALNFGGGGQFPLSARFALRADFREFVGFPSDGTSGLSTNGNADPIWMERATVGLDYHF